MLCFVLINSVLLNLSCVWNRELVWLRCSLASEQRGFDSEFRLSTPLDTDTSTQTSTRPTATRIPDGFQDIQLNVAVPSFPTLLRSENTGESHRHWNESVTVDRGNSYQGLTSAVSKINAIISPPEQQSSFKAATGISTDEIWQLL